MMMGRRPRRQFTFPPFMADYDYNRYAVLKYYRYLREEHSYTQFQARMETIQMMDGVERGWNALQQMEAL